MTINIDNLFDPIHIPVLNEESYKMLPTLIEFVDRFSKCCNLSLYIIDYKKHEFTYVSENKLFLSGYSVADVKQMGYSFYKRVVSDEDLDFLNEINKVSFQFYYEQHLDKRDQHVIEYDFDLCHVNKYKTRITHKLIPFCITSNGDIWLALCIVSTSFNKNTGSDYARVARIRNVYTGDEFLYSLITKTWDKQQQRELTRKELLILQYSAQSYTNQEIAVILNVNINTIKFHKKNIFEKLNVSNSQEAITVASRLGLF